MPFIFCSYYAGFSIIRFFDIDSLPDIIININQTVLYYLIMWGVFSGLFLNRQIYVSLFPYLIIPISKQTLCLFYQIISLFGKFNILTLSFIIGFWVKNIYLANVSFSWNWLLVINLLLICVHLVVNLLRFWSISGRYNPILGIFLVILTLAVLEWKYDIKILSGTSVTLFNASIEGAFWPSLILIGLVGILFQWSIVKMRRSFYIDYHSMMFRSRRNLLRRNMPRNQYLSCEWKLILRNRQPRSILMMLLVITSFSALFIVGLSTEVNVIYGQGIFLMFSTLLPAYYFIYAFDYRSAFYDGLQSRPISEIVILQTIVLVAHRWTLSILSIYIICITFFNIILDGMVFYEWIFIIGNILYGMGIVNFFALSLGISFLPIPRSLNAGLLQPDTFIERFVINPRIVFAFVFPTIFLCIPTIFLQFVSELWIGLALGMMGASGLCLQPLLINFLARHLHKRRYVIMERFRFR